jgi:AcrR family transcriptional regulator
VTAAAALAGRRPRGGLADKRRAILAGALRVFARDGYTRASIDAISADAGVSTRTIYNHFVDKAHLFQTVIQESATHVAAAQIAIMDRYLSKVTDVEADLIEFAQALAAPMNDFGDHFALVRQISAEAGHIPLRAIRAWQEAGPVRVRRELAGRMQQLADRGLLRIADPDQAAVHFMLLISGADTLRPGRHRRRAGRSDPVVAGVRAFLFGYLPRPDTAHPGRLETAM